MPYKDIKKRLLRKEAGCVLQREHEKTYLSGLTWLARQGNQRIQYLRANVNIGFNVLFGLGVTMW